MFWVLSFAILIVSLAFFHNYFRSQQKKIWDLKPNCLLTRYPLVFITGRRSLFYFLSYWNDIPDFLAQHGFQVELVNIRWNHTHHRFQDLQTTLQSYDRAGKRIHLCIDSTSLKELIRLIDSHHFRCVESIHLFGSDSELPPYRLKLPIRTIDLSEDEHRAPLFWQLHSILTFQYSLRKSSKTLQQLGWRLNLRAANCLLSQVQVLAETDLIKNSRFSTLNP
jgi:hypothetical protein